MQYKWGKDTRRRLWWRLRPIDSPDWHVLNSIATIYMARGTRRVIASYCWNSSTGNAPFATAVFKSVPRAKRWVESELAKFWEPPSIES